jgi:mannose-6-phosphate isomerase-like protein (cupin superfamily)
MDRARPGARPRYGAAVDAPHLVGPGEGERISERTTILVGRPEVAVAEFRYEPGDKGPDPHVHHLHADAFWVLEGRIALALGPDRSELELPAGGFALVPPDVVHTFRNPGPGRARYVNFHAPGMGFDEHLRGGADFDQHDPPADGGRPATEAIVRAPGEGEPLALGPSEATIKVGGDDALGSLAMIDMTIAPGFQGPVLHRHEAMLDSFYVLDGELTLRLGEREVPALPETYGFVPPGNPHTFSNPGDRPVHALNVMAPGGLERYLKQVAALSGGGVPDPAAMAEIASRYDFRAL